MGGHIWMPAGDREGSEFLPALPAGAPALSPFRRVRTFLLEGPGPPEHQTTIQMRRGTHAVMKLLLASWRVSYKLCLWEYTVYVCVFVIICCYLMTSCFWHNLKEWLCWIFIASEKVKKGPQMERKQQIRSPNVTLKIFRGGMGFKESSEWRKYNKTPIRSKHK